MKILRKLLILFYEKSNKLRVEEKDVKYFLLGSTKTKKNEKSPNKSWQCARLFRQRNI